MDMNVVARQGGGRRPPDRLRRLILVVVAALLASVPFTPAIPADRDALIEALRAGGYVLYFRHAQTDWSDPDRLDAEDALASCDRARMRQLSQEGRGTARAVGAAIRRLQIPFASVHSSEYCRCVQTAELLGLGPVQTTRDILNLRAAHYAGGREAVARTARARLSTPPPPGRNAVLVAHGNVFLEVAGQRPPEAGAAVVRPQGEGAFEVVGVLTAEDWIEAAEQPGRSGFSRDGAGPAPMVSGNAGSRLKPLLQR